MLDPAPITRLLRAKASSHLLVAAVHQFSVFETVADGPLSFEELSYRIGIRRRPAMVLFPALCAMGLLQVDQNKIISITELGRFLLKTTGGNLRGYTALEANDPGVLHMTNWLKHDGPEDHSAGLSYVKDEEADSPMDDPEAARFFTMALAGRAKYLSPVVARHITSRKGHLLDIAAGTGYYSYEWLRANPRATATLMDRPEVLRVAQEILDSYADQSLAERVTFLPGDMLVDELPEADIILAASLFHDWPEKVCVELMRKFVGALKTGGEVWVHDAFIDDSLDGPLAVTDYSAMLFLATKGRCYSRQEYRGWFGVAGLEPSGKNIPTLLDYGLISAQKP